MSKQSKKQRENGSPLRPSPLSVSIPEGTPPLHPGVEDSPASRKLQRSDTAPSAPDSAPTPRGSLLTPLRFARTPRGDLPDSLFKSVHAKQGLKVYRNLRAKKKHRSATNLMHGTWRQSCTDADGDQVPVEASGASGNLGHLTPEQDAAPARALAGYKHLRVVIHEARQLIAKDLNGYSDPFVLVELAGQRSRTRVVPSSLNPNWEQVVDLELPQTLDRRADRLRLTVLDDDGPLVQPEFLGRVEISVSDLYDSLGGQTGEAYERRWCKLMGNRRTKRSERGDICVTLSLLEVGDAASSTGEAQADAAAHSSTLEDTNLNDWQLRVRIHEGRAFDSAGGPRGGHTPPQHRESGGAPLERGQGFLYRVSIRLGSSVYPTSYSPGNFAAVAELGPHRQAPATFSRIVWEESFDIPLREATKTLTLDTRINNHFIRMGNQIGLDGIFYDTREDMCNTDDVRFVISRIRKEDMPPPVGKHAAQRIKDSDRSFIAGVGQFPLSGIYAYSEDPCHEDQTIDRSDHPTASIDPAAAGNIPLITSDQRTPGADPPGCNGEGPDGAKQTCQTPPPTPPTLPEGSPMNGGEVKHVQASPRPGSFARIQNMLSKAGRIFEDGAAGRRNCEPDCADEAEEELSTSDRRASEDKASSLAESNEDCCEELSRPVAQQTWVPIDGKNGTAAGELLVSFLFVKGKSAASSQGSDNNSSPKKAPHSSDFNLWLQQDGAEDLGAQQGEEVPPLAMPQPLKDATFADLEVDIPLPKLFYMQANQDSKFNKLRRFEAKIRDFEAQEWRDAGAVVKAQSMSYLIKLPPNTLGPNEAYTEVEMAVEQLSRAGYVLRQTIVNPKITFGDAFYTVLQTVAVPVSPTRTRLQITFACEFTKTCIFKSTIQRAALSGAKGGCEAEVALLERLAKGGDNAAPSTEAAGLAPSTSLAGIRSGSAATMAAGFLDPVLVLGALACLLMVLVGLLVAQLFAVQRTATLQIEATQQSIELQLQAQADQARLVNRLLDVLAERAPVQSVGGGSPSQDSN